MCHVLRRGTLRKATRHAPRSSATRSKLARIAYFRPRQHSVQKNAKFCTTEYQSFISVPHLISAQKTPKNGHFRPLFGRAKQYAMPRSFPIYLQHQTASPPPRTRALAGFLSNREAKRQTTKGFPLGTGLYIDRFGLKNLNPLVECRKRRNFGDAELTSSRKTSNKFGSSLDFS